MEIRQVVDDFEEMRLHPLSEHMRIPAVVIKSYYIVKDESLGLEGFCLKYAEREDGITGEFDEMQWSPRQTPPEKSIIVTNDGFTSSFVHGKCEMPQGLTAREYVAFLINNRAKKLLDALRELIHGWSNELRIWDDLLDMAQTKLLVLDPELHGSLTQALRVEGQFYRNLLFHGQAIFDVNSSLLVIGDSFFGKQGLFEVHFADQAEFAAFLREIDMGLAELGNCSAKLRSFLAEKFDMQEILEA